jgi:hypothetical protein
MHGLRIRLILILIAINAAAVQAASAEKRIALVIGNAAYQNVPALENPVNDARLMAETLRSVGFTLIGDGPQINLDKANLDRAVQAFGAALTGADVGLFYYAGHGAQVRGINYLVPIGANPTKEADADFQMLDAGMILRQMEGAGTKLNMLVLDACRNNPFIDRGLRTSTSGLAQMQAPEGTLISFATQPGAVANDGTSGNSPFTTALADAVRRPGIDIFRTFNEVGLMVSKATAGSQQPWVSMSPIKADFYFVKANTNTTAAPSAALSAPEPAVTCSTLDQRIQLTLSDGMKSREQFKAALFDLRALEQKISNPCAFGKVLGGPIVKIHKCMNGTTYIELGGATGGAFALMDNTRNYQDTMPTKKGQWIIGTMGALYYCVASIAPTTVLSATIISTMSVK